MSLRRFFLSRRINSRSSALPKSFKEFKSLEFSQTQPRPHQSSTSGNEDNIRNSNRGTNDGNAGVDSTTDGGNGDSDGGGGGGSWSYLLPELLGEIIKRIEESDDRWPLRHSVVACGCVCKSWRDVTREIVKPPVRGGKITFPSCAVLPPLKPWPQAPGRSSARLPPLKRRPPGLVPQTWNEFDADCTWTSTTNFLSSMNVHRGITVNHKSPNERYCRCSN